MKRSGSRMVFNISSLMKFISETASFTELYLLCCPLVAKELQLDFLGSGLRGSKLASFNHLGDGCCCFL